ncbi:MAG: tetratricopeptide repeat protein [Thermoanaerobaculia bacterium]|nr:tetratricopeptide repeat protein [Thermoanaerobaculia bacterium]
MAIPPPGRTSTALGVGVLVPLVLGWLAAAVFGAPIQGQNREPIAQAQPLPSAAIPAHPPLPPLPPPGEMARCKALIDNGQFEVARTRLLPIVEQHPGWARAALLLGLTYYRQHRFEAARPYFQQALAADPDETAIHPFYGYTLYALGELAEAETVFQSLLEKRPQYASAHYALGLVYLDLDDRKAAAKHLESTIELAAAADDLELAARGQARLGDVLLRNGDLDAARRRLELALTTLDDDPGAVAALSRVLDRLGEHEAAASVRARFETLIEDGQDRPRELPE